MRARRVVGVLAVAAGAVGLVGPVPGAGAQETATTVPQYGNRPVKIALEVRTDNEQAIRMYEAYGFVRLGLRKRYYQPANADAYTMGRPPSTIDDRAGKGTA